MPMPTSPLAFKDCYEIFDEVLDGPGCRIGFGDEGSARHFRTRLHTARALNRRANAEVYDLDHPMYGKSIYDPLTIKLRFLDGKWWLYIQQVKKPEGIEQLNA